MRTTARTLLPVFFAWLILGAGCNNGHPPDDGSSATKQPAWPVSTAPPDTDPRDLFRRCRDAIRNGDSHEYVACYRGNDPSYRELYRLAFEYARAYMQMMDALREQYGKEAPKRFRDLGSFCEPMDFGEHGWPSQGTVEWDGSSDHALWYVYDMPKEDQLPRQLRRLDGHWCFVIRENPMPADARIVNELTEKAKKTTEAAREGPAKYTLEQVYGIYDRADSP